MLSCGTQQWNDDAENASLFGKFFYSVFARSSNLTDSDNLTADVVSSLRDLKFSNYKIYNILANLDALKAVGIDGIGPRILRNCALPLCYPHCLLCAKCLQQCAIPSKWGVNIVIPVHKSRDKNLVNNYRPISLLCNTSKNLCMIKLSILFLNLFLQCSLVLLRASQLFNNW